MASPQLDGGFAQVANEILERLCAAGLSGQELSVMLLIVRFSYGMLKQKSVLLPIKEIASYLDVHKSVVSKLLKRMESKGLIVCLSPARGRTPAEYRIQKNWERWNVQRNTPWPRLFGVKETLEPGSLSCTQSATQTGKQHTPFCNSTGSNLQPYGSDFATQRGQNCNSSDRETHTSVESGCPPIKDKEIKDKNPPTPKGGAGGHEGSDRHVDQAESGNSKKSAAETLYRITGIKPTKKDLSTVKATLSTPTPPGWEQLAWRRHCSVEFNERLNAVTGEHSRGASFSSVYAIACARTRQRLEADARIPHEFGGQSP